MNTIKAWKRIGETPLQTLVRVKEDYKFPSNTCSCYTGRLDPMAQGQITLLFNDMIHQANKYNHSHKTYRYQAILGVATTSYDAMGRITQSRPITSLEAHRFQQAIIGISGLITQQLPPCSAFRYKGKALWKHVREGTLPIIIPSRPVDIIHTKCLHSHPINISLDHYKKECLEDIQEVMYYNPNSFSYTEIVNDWKHLAEPDSVWRIIFESKVSSGTYIRSLVHDQGVLMDIPAHAFRITRISTDI